MADITSGLVYNLPLDDDAASTAVVPSVDSGAFGNSTLNGGDNTSVKHSLDLSGNSFFNMNGIDDWVQLPNIASALADDNMSVSFWAKYGLQLPALTNDGGLFHMGETGANHDNLIPWGGDGLGYISVFRNNPSLTRVDGVTLPAGIDRTEWFLITITQDSGANGWNLYLNNTLVTSVTGLSSLSWGSGPEFRWGRGRTGTTDFFLGGLRDIRIYSRQLAAADVECLFLTSIIGENSAPIQHPFNFSNFE